jgi:hypothetical protein
LIKVYEIKTQNLIGTRWVESTEPAEIRARKEVREETKNTPEGPAAEAAPSLNDSRERRYSPTSSRVVSTQ